MMGTLDDIFGIFVLIFMLACVLVPLALGLRALWRRKFVWAGAWLVIACVCFVGNPVVHTLVFEKVDLEHLRGAVRLGQ